MVDLPPAPLDVANRVAVAAPPSDAGINGARPEIPASETQDTPLDSASTTIPVAIASGEKAKARDILAAIRTLQRIEQEQRPATQEERQTLARFPGFGAVATHLFPKPGAKQREDAYPDDGWRALGEELISLLTPEEYGSARRTTYTAYYTAPLVMQAMHDALQRLGVPADATMLEPGCGIGNFMASAPPSIRFIGVEQDRLSGRLTRALHPGQDIRIEDFRDTRLPESRIDAVIGNVPFSDEKVTYDGHRLSLHDFFLAKSLDALKPGGVLALVTSHYTLDKQHAGLREHLAEQADFLGAIRLPADAFQREGTKVVTDILLLRKRAPGEPAHHVDPEWLHTAPFTIEGVDIPINLYFHHHPEMVLGTWTRQDRLYGGAANYSLMANGDLAEQLPAAIARLPEGVFSAEATQGAAPADAIPLPPLDRHVTEGSFFIADDGAILQVQCGQAVPVTHGDTVLQANGPGVIERRLGQLIHLRDDARLVLQSQNDGWPVAQRDEARRLLNRDCDAFVAAYGPINKTTFSTTADGTVIRRMPNLVKFLDDPDAMLVMSLEDYDEATGQAAKAAILRKDVVGRRPPITSVRSAEEGLLVSLNHRGKVDLPTIATLYDKPVREIIAELGDLLYQDPDTGEWQTADAYLSGNVRAKLAAAERAGAAYARNAEALRTVQPEDVLPSEIYANLGAPWIPEDDIQAFAADLFGVPPSSIDIGHLKKDALWTVDGDVATRASVAATTDYGTERAGGVWLLEQALNLRSPTIYDVFQVDGKEERVVNQDDTLAAREKQKRIKERFRTWIFADPERAERLVRLYNDTYNTIRLRSFDGAHLDFPGMNQTITLHPHQKDAVWRVMSDGNTLLAHAVGAGKTFTMAAAGMKMKQAGLIKKPMYVVPNHMLEQFAREFMQLYPNARLLIAGKEDLTRDRRKLLTAKIASGDWDGIIVTHSSFERIGMSRDYQERFLREQIAEYDQLLCDSASADSSRAHRNLIKNIEKQKVKREQRLKDLLAEEKKDDGLVFDELGVDHLFVDEAHLFKNLETATKMDRVAGIQTGGSERAFDLFMKARYLHQQHPGHGVTFATGTPISNTICEMYTLQHYLDPDGLQARGIDHFDGWAACFGEIVDTMEISPDGKTLRPRSRFAQFVNLSELQQMFRSFADVKTKAMLDLPCPEVETRVVARPMSEEQRAMQEHLVKRYEAIRAGKVKPWEDNALAVTTDGRKLALDARLLSSTALTQPYSKIEALEDIVAETWRETAATRSTQLIFCDIGVNLTAWGYSVYQEIVDTLVARGIPREDIGIIGEADTDAKKQALFDKVNAGRVRIVLGSTQKMGAGTNVQERLVALHDLDCPWKPAEIEQRRGRIERQGNTHAKVRIYRYVTEGSFDAYMWQANEVKARFIGQIMTGDLTVRRAEDIGGQELSYAEVKAIASGNPAVLTLAEADAELKRLTVLKKHQADEQYTARTSVRELPERIARLERRLADLAQDRETATAHAADPVTIGGRTCGRDEVLDILARRLHAVPDHVYERRAFPLGCYRGLRFSLVLQPQGTPDVCVEGAVIRYGTLSRDSHGPRAILNAVDRVMGSYEVEREKTTRDLDIAQGQFRDYEARLGAGFAHEAYLEELTGLRHQLEAALADKPDAIPPSTEELVARIKVLKAAQTIEPAPERPAKRSAATSAEPVTTRIRHRLRKAEPALACQAESVQPDAPATPPASAPVPEPVPPIRGLRFAVPLPRTSKPKPLYQQRVTRDHRPATPQLSLF